MSKRVVDIEQFVARTKSNELYAYNPYDVAPDGELGQEAFPFIREIVKREKAALLAFGGPRL